MSRNSWVLHLCHELFQAGAEKTIKLTRLRATAAGIRIIQGIRYVFLLHYFFLLASFIGSLALFFLAYLLSLQAGEPQGLHLTWPLGTCGVLFLISLGIFIFTLREKTWIRVFQVEELVNAALGEKTSEACNSSSEMTPEMVASIVEKVIDKKLKTFQLKT